MRCSRNWGRRHDRLGGYLAARHRSRDDGDDRSDDRARARGPTAARLNDRSLSGTSGFFVVMIAGAIPVAARAVAVGVADYRLAICAVTDALADLFADVARAALILLEHLL